MVFFYFTDCSLLSCYVSENFIAPILKLDIILALNHRRQFSREDIHKCSRISPNNKTHNQIDRRASHILNMRSCISHKKHLIEKESRSLREKIKRSRNNNIILTSTEGKPDTSLKWGIKDKLLKMTGKFSKPL